MEESVQRINSNLITHEPLRWERERVRTEMHDLLSQEYEELWDDYCDLKQVLHSIAALNPSNPAAEAVNRAWNALRKHA